MMLYSTYNLLVSGFLLLLITFVATTSASTWLIVTSGICCFAVTFSLGVLFLPKMYFQCSGKEIDAAAMFGRAIQRSSEDGSSLSIPHAQQMLSSTSTTGRSNIAVVPIAPIPDRATVQNVGNGNNPILGRQMSNPTSTALAGAISAKRGVNSDRKLSGPIGVIGAAEVRSEERAPRMTNT
jgi:hypothetical protein